MPSAVISAAKDQLTLNFEPGLAERYGSLRECIATGVYQRGLKRVAIDLDQAPSNLSVQLSEDTRQQARGSRAAQPNGCRCLGK